MKTMKKLSMKVGTIALAGALVTGCASPLTSSQSRELQEYKAKGIAVQEKNPTGATLAGLLPGGGSWYTGHWGPAVANTLLWPYSIFWDPVSGYNGAKTANYFATKAHVEDQRTAALDELDYKLEDGDITESEYRRERRAIRRKY